MGQAMQKFTSLTAGAIALSVRLAYLSQQEAFVG